MVEALGHYVAIVERATNRAFELRGKHELQAAVWLFCTEKGFNRDEEPGLL